MSVYFRSLHHLSTDKGLVLYLVFEQAAKFKRALDTVQIRYGKLYAKVC